MENFIPLSFVCLHYLMATNIFYTRLYKIHFWILITFDKIFQGQVAI